MTKTTCYLAGPMTGIPRFNFPAFDAAKKELEERGYEVVSPADLDRATGFDEHSDTAPPLRECASRDLNAIIDRCGTIAVLPGWKNSKGTRAELALAQWLDLEVIFL